MLSRKVVLVVAAVAVCAAAGITFWQLQTGGKGHAALQTAAVTRRAVLVTVGGVGRVVEGNAATQLAVPAAPSAGGAFTSASSTTASPDSVFPSVSGHAARVLAVPGQHVFAGEPLVLLDDGGATTLAVAQAQFDLATARLELAQKRVSDPAKGLPASVQELASAQLAVKVARQKLKQTISPTRADITAAQLDQRKARADLATLQRPPTQASLDAAVLSLDLATQKLDTASGPPSQVDVAAAQLELKKAQADLETLQRPAPGPSSAALSAAQLAVTLAQQKIAELPVTATPSERTAAQLDLQKAQADQQPLKQAPPGPGAAAVAAAQAAIDLASQKLAVLTGQPAPAVVTAAQLDLKRAQADLAALQRLPMKASLDAANLAVRLADDRYAQLRNPAPAVRNGARLDIAKALTDLGTLRKRGAPASPTDISIAGLKVQAAQTHLALALAQASRLVVRAPAAGTVTGVLVSPGSPADPSTPIATVANLRSLAVRADLSEFDTARVHNGDRVLVSVDALGGRTLPGTVLFVAPVGVDNGGVVSFPVRIGLTRLAAGIRPGMNVSVRIIVAGRRNVLAVPLEAVHNGRVTVVDASGRTADRRVRLGLADNKQVEIRGGLRPGERVVLAGGGGGGGG